MDNIRAGTILTVFINMHVTLGDVIIELLPIFYQPSQ